MSSLWAGGGSEPQQDSDKVCVVAGKAWASGRGRGGGDKAKAAEGFWLWECWEGNAEHPEAQGLEAPPAVTCGQDHASW